MHSSPAAIIFLFAGAFVMSIVTEAQAMAVLRNLRRKSRHPSILRLASSY
jgi:hypothetical protein